MREEEWRERGGGKRKVGLTVCYGIQDCRAARVLSFRVEDGSLPRDDLPHHRGHVTDGSLSISESVLQLLCSFKGR